MARNTANRRAVRYDLDVAILRRRGIPLPPRGNLTIPEYYQLVRKTVGNVSPQSKRINNVGLKQFERRLDADYLRSRGRWVDCHATVEEVAAIAKSVQATPRYRDTPEQREAGQRWQEREAKREAAYQPFADYLIRLMGIDQLQEIVSVKRFK